MCEAVTTSKPFHWPSSRYSFKPLRMMPRNIWLLFCSIWTLGSFSCEANQEQKTALLALFEEEKELRCSLAAMKDSISMQWDQINLLLENNMPAEMPGEERANMLKVRNANLIRMFQSFEQMDEGVKVALQATEQMDQEMAQSITAMKKTINDIETQKMKLLSVIEKTHGPEEVTSLKELLQVKLSEQCH